MPVCGSLIARLGQLANGRGDGELKRDEALEFSAILKGRAHCKPREWSSNVRNRVPVGTGEIILPRRGFVNLPFSDLFVPGIFRLPFIGSNPFPSIQGGPSFLVTVLRDW